MAPSGDYEFIDSLDINAYDVSEKLKVTVDLRKHSIKLQHTM